MTWFVISVATTAFFAGVLVARKSDLNNRIYWSHIGYQFEMMDAMIASMREHAITVGPSANPDCWRADAEEYTTLVGSGDDPMEAVADLVQQIERIPNANH